METKSKTVVTHKRCSTLGCDMKVRVIITAQHAYSLSEMVKWFKELIAQGNIPDDPGRSDELTAAYCDELLEDLAI